MLQKLEAFARLLKIMDELREQCPWDRKQTFQSLRNLTIEETYELADAILDEDLPGIKEEIGDLMLHMVFYAKIASESGAWDIADALHAVCDKLIKRHPHIYGDLV
ncbi:MAG: nucleoside triphosphate pyrophosphohydrolase, partial [Saprospiraceae bacterium]|nr:nucleoside triphosphate pyrophosphohydrolase [Saprospiraceae bacterium]